MSNRVKLTGMWENRTKAGDAFFSGNLGGARLTMWKNGYKKKETDPDYIIYLEEKQKREEPKPDPDFTVETSSGLPF